ncbi:MAG: D-alanine--D-alanine ligase [Phycisphaerae bacterium]
MTQIADHVALTPVNSKTVERRLRITVLSGGPSSEREVSLKSGRAVAAALKSLGHEVCLADISPDDLSALDRPMDMVFIALHGAFGEDGQLQKILDDRGIRYCGSGPQASAMAMNKALAKARFMEVGVPTPLFEVVTSDNIDQVLVQWTPPVVVKPLCEGSSVDCVIVHEGQNLATPIRKEIEIYGQCMIERFVKGAELTVGVLGDEPLPPIQIRPKREFYNYEAKYLDNDTQYLFNIDLPATLLGEICDLSVRAHQSLGCRDFSRVDWIVEESTNRPFVLEVNTIPGFTDHSLLPKAAQQAGLGFAQLCQRIVELTYLR